MKFKHNKKSVLKAMGSELSLKDVDKALLLSIKKFIDDDSIGKVSHLAEIIHNDLPYEAILYLAVRGIKEKVITASELSNPMTGLVEGLSKIKNRDETRPSFLDVERFINYIVKRNETDKSIKD